MTIIAAVAADRGIGKKGGLLWHIPEDLRHFKQVTMGCPVIMGRNTWESLPKKPLPGRKNIVVSRTPGYSAEGAEVCTNLEAALLEAQTEEKECFIIGGGALYSEAISRADALELTEIDAVEAEADTFFPEFDIEEWRCVKSEAHESSGLSYRFSRLERISNQ